MKNLFKSFIQAIKPYQPGKPIKEVERELGIRNVVKLASNENPLGPSRKALWAMRRAIREAHIYPDGACFYLVRRLAQELSVAENQLIIGNGSNEIIELLTRGFLSEGDEVISAEMSFLVYPIITQLCGAKFINVPMKNYRYDLKAIADAVTERTKLIFIANPNNPTGTYVNVQEVEEFLARVPKSALVIFDEAYVDFVEAKDFPHMLFYVKTDRPNLILLRTFSKSYGLAGLRVGYAVAHADIIGYLHKVRQPFNVNSIAQAAATAALDDRFFLWRTKRLVDSGRRYLYRHFKKLGLEYLPSQANFVLVKVGGDGDALCRAMLKHGMIVRPMGGYKLPDWIRVTVGRRSQNAHFVRALRACLRERAATR
ncbi:MAG: histidinol-phosphate transaminase [Candidatus Omnitrophica bacterium]|nr:histidinol-phosphate transaminase [Candidatus Omnitrophota bacterium]